jgi:hypothetical protein
VVVAVVVVVPLMTGNPSALSHAMSRVESKYCRNAKAMSPCRCSSVVVPCAGSTFNVGGSQATVVGVGGWGVA